jgi:hypothetical protein
MQVWWPLLFAAGGPVLLVHGKDSMPNNFSVELRSISNRLAPEIS